MNQFILVGKVIEEPIVQETIEGNKFSVFTIDSKRDKKNSDGVYESDVYKITLYDSLAINLKDLLKLGSLTGIKGRISVDKAGVISLIGERVSVLERNS